MNATAIQNLIISTLTDYGATALVILTAVIGVSVAYLAFKFGWNRTQSVLPSFDFEKAEDLKTFFSKKGKTNAPYDWTNMHK